MQVTLGPRLAQLVRNDLGSLRPITDKPRARVTFIVTEVILGFLRACLGASSSKNSSMEGKRPCSAGHMTVECWLWALILKGNYNTLKMDHTLYHEKVFSGVVVVMIS